MKIVASIATFYFLSIFIAFLGKMATQKTKKTFPFIFLFFKFKALHSSFHFTKINHKTCAD